jgi:methyl-accepting chemotaxis protein
MFTWFRNLKVGAKIGLGFGLMTLLLAVIVISTIAKVRGMTEVTSRAIEVRAPTAMTSLTMLNGINHSLAALRGWIILGKDKFKD